MGIGGKRYGLVHGFQFGLARLQSVSDKCRVSRASSLADRRNRRQDSRPRRYRQPVHKRAVSAKIDIVQLDRVTLLCDDVERHGDVFTFRIGRIRDKLVPGIPNLNDGVPVRPESAREQLDGQSAGFCCRESVSVNLGNFVQSP